MKVITFFRQTIAPLEEPIMIEVDAKPDKVEVVLEAVRKVVLSEDGWEED